jgi:hypothetical protein
MHITGHGSPLGGETLRFLSLLEHRLRDGTTKNIVVVGFEFLTAVIMKILYNDFIS